MKIKKRYLFPIVICIVSLVSCITLILSTNLTITSNVYSKAEKELKIMIDTYYTDELIEIDDKFEIYDESDMFVEQIIIDSVENDFLYPYERKLLDYIEVNNLEEGTIYNTDIDNERVYFTFIPSYFLGQSNRELFYVNTKSYLYTLNGVNDILIVVSIIILILSIIIGHKVGVSLENSEKKLKRFFANASHELKTPLTSIQGYAESIHLGISPDIKSSSKIVIDQCEHMEKLIEELLLLSKIDSEALKVELVELNIYEVLDRLVDYTKGIASQKNIEVACNFNDNEIIIKSDEKYIYNALSAIVSNGLRYAKSKVDIKVEVVDKKLIISIKDDGIGINEKDLPHIFDRFYIGEKGGTGIGLSLAKEIVKIHGGDISAHNDNGAVFKISLPLYKY